MAMVVYVRYHTEMELWGHKIFLFSTLKNTIKLCFFYPSLYDYWLYEHSSKLVINTWKGQTFKHFPNSDGYTVATPTWVVWFSATVELAGHPRMDAGLPPAVVGLFSTAACILCWKVCFDYWYLCSVSVLDSYSFLGYITFSTLWLSFTLFMTSFKKA